MGLLDYIFDPGSYSGQGGLLSRLQPSLASVTPSQGFQDQPATFADRWNALPAGTGRSFDAAAFDPSTYAPSQPNNPIAVGSYQMPRLGNPDQFVPQQAMTPPNAMPTQGTLPQQAAPAQLPPALGGNSFGGKFGAGLQNFVNAGGPLQAIAGGLTGLLTGQRSDPQGMAQQNLKAQYDSLVPLLGPQKALLAVMNPEAGKTLLNEALTNKEEFKIVKDALGAEHPYWINNREQTMRPADAPGGANSASGGVSLLAPGVQQYNPALTGEDYLNQFGPEVKAAVKAYINGDVMPSGNPRQQAIATKAKEIAQKYGMDTGIPVSDATYSEKRKYRTELGTNSPNSAGGQAKAFNQGIDHLSHLADVLEKLDNSNGLGIPALASATNAVRQGVSTNQSAIADEAKSLGQTVAGEVGKLFSGSAGGGVHERELTRERFDTVKSKPQLAAALRATIETMQGGLHALEQRRDAVLGPNSGVELVDQSTRDKIAKIQGVIDRLEGKAPAQAGGVQEGATATNPQTGAKIVFKGGKWVPAQ